MAKPDEGVILHLDDIRLNTDGMRNCRSNVEDVEALAQDILEEGKLLNRIGVWKPEGKDYYVLNYGYRRFAALLYLRETAPDFFKAMMPLECSEHKGDLDEALTRNLRENITHRKITKVDLMNHVYYLHSARGLTEMEIAKAINMSQPSVSGMMGVKLNCIPGVVKAMKKGLIALEVAKKLATMPHDKQEEALATLLENPDLKKAFGKLVDKKLGLAAPSKKTLREKIKQISTYGGARDVEYRAGVVLGLQYALGACAEEKLLLEPGADLQTEAPVQPAKGQRIRAKKAKLEQFDPDAEPASPETT